MKPMLARKYGPKYDKFPCFLQPKLNGVRALYQHFDSRHIFQSREEIVWPQEKLAHFNEDLDALRDVIKDRILDGELYRHGWRLQQINGAVAVKSKAPRDDTHEIQYCIFDVVDPVLPFSERFLDFKLQLDAYGKQVEDRYQRPPTILAVQTDHIYFREQVDQFLSFYTLAGFEGVMLRPDGRYDFGQTPHGTEYRSPSLWKYKHWEDSEFLCVSITQGQGKAAIGIGALICITRDGKAFRVGTGYSDAERIELMQNPPINHYIKVRYNFLSADGIPTPAAQFCCVIPR